MRMEIAMGFKLATGVCAAFAALAAPAFAQDAPPAESFDRLQFDASGRIIFAAGAFDQDAAEQSEPIGLRLELELGVETVLDSGLALGAELDLAGEHDHPARTPRGGRAGECPAGLADCATIAGVPVRAPVSGFGGDAIREDSGWPRGAVEEAYVYLDGGWGEISLGLTEGAAAELSLPTPTILAGASTVDGHLNLTGLGGAQTINDLSGSSAKIALESVSLFGLSAALSYAPESNHRTLDHGFPRRAGEAVTYEAEDIWEGGVRFERIWASGLETRAALTYLTGESAVSAPEWGGIEAWSAGLQLGYGPLRGGFSYLESDNGWAQGDRGYQAYAASGVYEIGPWSMMLEGSSADDDLAHVQVGSLVAGVSRPLDDSSVMSLSLLHQQRSVPVADAFGRTQVQESATGLLLEIAADL